MVLQLLEDGVGSRRRKAAKASSEGELPLQAHRDVLDRLDAEDLRDQVGQLDDDVPIPPPRLPGLVELHLDADLALLARGEAVENPWSASADIRAMAVPGR